MFHCTNCGAGVQMSHKFCPQCGSRLSISSPLTSVDIGRNEVVGTHVERIACPHCNQLVWVNVPADKRVESLSPGYWSSGNDCAKQSCPECGRRIYVNYEPRH